MVFPSPDYESARARARGAKVFTKVMAVLSIVIIGGTILLNHKTLTIDDYLALVGPFLIMFFIWLFRRHIAKVTGVEWIPPLP